MKTPKDFKAARRQLGLTQTGMAQALELANGDSATVRSWENGRRNPSGPVRVAIRLMLVLQELRGKECHIGSMDAETAHRTADICLNATRAK